MNIKCIIVDDEPLAVSIMEGYINKIPNIEIIGTFNSAVSVYDFMKTNTVDLMFLDVEMPDLSGLDFLRTLKTKPYVVLTTANRNYAINGFDLNVDDYILKPVTFERLIKSINRVIESIDSHQSVKNEYNQLDFLYLKENKRMVKVFLNEILFIESIKDYVKVVTSSKTVITKQQISYFETIFDSNHFLRVHRSFIVSKDKIDAFSYSSIEVGSVEIPIGRKYKDFVISELIKSDSVKCEEVIG